MPVDNLLVKLLGWATQQSENFTTESFAHVVEHLVDARPEAAARVLTWLTAGQVKIDAREVGGLEIRRQFQTPTHGRPDLLIDGEDLAIIVEVKLDGSLGNEQVSAYATALGEIQKPRRGLVGLVGQSPAATLPVGIVIRLWRELAEVLHAECASPGAAGEVSPITEHEVSQFLGLLGHLRLLPPPRVATPLADALRHYTALVDATPGAVSIFDARVRSLMKLDASPSLAPVRHLLLQMREAILRADFTARLESGRFGQYPWIGYTMDNLRYFIELNLHEPHRVTLVRYRGGVARERFERVTPKVGRVVRLQGLARWAAELDLVKSGYFELDASDQVALIDKFIRESVEFAEAVWPRAEGDG